MTMLFGNSTSHLSINQTTNQTLIMCNHCNDFTFVAYSVAYMFNFLVGLPANVWVLWLMRSSPSLLTDKMEVFEFSLAVNDLIYCLMSPLFVIGFSFFKQFSQYILATIQGLIYFGRPLFQTLICLERYLAVVHPVVFLRYRPLRYRAAISTLAWLADILFCYGTFCLCGTYLKTVAIISSLLQMLVLSINSFFCLSILRALFQPGPGDGRRGGGGEEGEKEGMNLMKKRAVTTVLIIQVAMVFAYLPGLVNMLMFQNVPLKTFCLINLFCYSLNVVVGLVLPLLHLRRAGKLKLAFL